MLDRRNNCSALSGHPVALRGHERSPFSHDTGRRAAKWDEQRALIFRVGRFVRAWPLSLAASRICSQIESHKWPQKNSHCSAQSYARLACPTKPSKTSSIELLRFFLRKQTRFNRNFLMHYGTTSSHLLS